MNQSAPARTVVGIVPWLPWPFSSSAAWTQPVRAERLALLRIGIALCVIVDIAWNYAPETLTFFAKGSLGDPSIHEWRFDAPRMTWSLLRGVGDPVLVSLALTLWIGTTVWILGASLARLVAPLKSLPRDDRTGIALFVWIVASIFYVTGIWSTTLTGGTIDEVVWAIPLVAFSMACLFAVLDLGARLRDEEHRILWVPLASSLVFTATLAVLGVLIARIEEFDKTVWWAKLLHPWQDDDMLLITLMGMWLTSAIFLLVGCCTRFSAVLTWMLAMSFGNANEYLDNAGDTIRMILLFYVMLCPCGATLSIDAIWRKTPPSSPRPSGGEGSGVRGFLYVSPWPVRLIFVQMIFIYWMNGIYKLFGEAWLSGESLHYVLADIVLARVSAVSLPLPFWVTQAMTWSVLVWEVTFPLMALWKWSRRAALVFGVMFHLGIFASMELALFVPYALCMYLPLIPWPGEGDAEPTNR